MAEKASYPRSISFALGRQMLLRYTTSPPGTQAAAPKVHPRRPPTDRFMTSLPGTRGALPSAPTLALPSGHSKANGCPPSPQHQTQGALVRVPTPRVRGGKGNTHRSVSLLRSTCMRCRCQRIRGWGRHSVVPKRPAPRRTRASGLAPPRDRLHRGFPKRARFACRRAPVHGAAGCISRSCHKHC